MADSLENNEESDVSPIIAGSANTPETHAGGAANTAVPSADQANAVTSDKVSDKAVDKAVDPLALRQALTKLRPLYAALPDAARLPIRVDPPSAAMQVLNQLDEIEPYRAKIVQLPFVNQDYIVNLEPAAMGLLEVYSQSQVAGKLPPEVMKTYREATTFRDGIKDEAGILVRRGLLPRGSLEAVSGDHGYRNTAVDLTALGNVLRDHWSVIAGKCAITAEEIDRCSVVAQMLFRNADDRLQRVVVPAHLTLLKQQAYTYLVLAFEELRRCIEFLDRDALDRIAPSLFQGRGRKPGTGAVDPAIGTVPPSSAEDSDEARIFQELTAPPAAAAAESNSNDPVARAEALQAGDSTAKPSKNPFSG